MMTPLPCPFCGSTNITAQNGSTFRWWYAGCCECGAQAGEVRRQTLGDGTNDEWDAKAADDAIKEWNTRAPVAVQPELCMCKDRLKVNCPGEWEPGCDLGANEKFVKSSREQTP